MAAGHKPERSLVIEALDHNQKQSAPIGARLPMFVAASIVVHVMGAVVLWSAAEPAPPASPTEVVELEAAYLPLAPPPTSKSARAASSRPAKDRARQAVPATLKSPTPAPRARVRKHRLRAGTAPPPPPPVAPERRPAPAPMSLSMRGQRLSLNLPERWEYTEPQRRKRTTPRKVSAREKSWLLKQRLDRMLARDASARAVSGGRAHASLYDLMRDARKSFSPTWAMVDGDRRRRGTMSDTAKNILRSLGSDYLKRVKRYMKQGGGHRLPGARDSDENDMLSGYAGIIRMAEKDASGLQCALCVTVDHKQKPRITFLRRSGKKVFDAAALSALRRAARIRKLPADAPSAVACYRFSAKYFTVPPLPTILCSFDESVPTITCYYPGKRVMKKDVVLESVEVLGDQG